MSEPKPQSLAQLQAEWRNHGKQPHDDYYAGVWDSLMDCANSLQPHVEREAAAQAKSLADERRIADYKEALERIAHFGNDTTSNLFGADAMGMREIARAALRVGDAIYE